MVNLKSKPKSWRDVYRVHPAADIFPMMEPDDLRALAKDIRANTLQNPVLLWSQSVADAPEGALLYVLDGRNRLDAMEQAGIPVLGDDGQLLPHLYTTIADMSSMSAGALAVALNIKRRHLTPTQRATMATAALTVDREFQKSLVKGAGLVVANNGNKKPRAHRVTGKAKTGRPKSDTTTVAEAAKVSKETARKAVVAQKRVQVEQMLRDGMKRDEIVKTVHVNPNFIAEVKKAMQPSVPVEQPKPARHTTPKQDRRILGILHELEEIAPDDVSDPVAIGKTLVAEGHRFMKGGIR